MKHKLSELCGNTTILDVRTVNEINSHEIFTSKEVMAIVKKIIDRFCAVY